MKVQLVTSKNMLNICTAVNRVSVSKLKIFAACNWKKLLEMYSEVCLKVDVRGSVYHSIIHTEVANKMQQCIKIYYSMFM